MAFSLSRLALLGATLCLALPLHAASTEIEHGKYVAQLGDCIACHTAKQGKVMAGGLALSTPMGTIYSSNITPDRESGIGSYTFEQFDKVMREGVTPAGVNLYPAMPYPSFALVKEDDMRAMYAYFMHGVPAVEQKPEQKPQGDAKNLYRVQLGAFEKKDNATAFAAKLKKEGFDTYIVQIGKYYKVQVGAFGVKKNAEAMLEKLKKAGHDDAFITYSGTSGGTSERKIKTGSKVRVKAGAKTYSGGSLASFVYSRDHIVKELSGKRAVITYGGTVVAAVNVDDLTLV